jgi:hypothetical protein
MALIVEFFYEAVTLNQGLSAPTETALVNLYRLFAYYYLELQGNDCKHCQSCLQFCAPFLV